MKEIISSEKSSNIMIGVGALGLLAYGYLLLFSDISKDDMKYSVMACAFASLLPLAVTIRKMIDDFSTWMFWGVVIGVAALVFLVAYSMMKATGDGVIFDLFAVGSSESFRWLYLVLLVVVTICPFVWGKGAPWLLSITMGVLVPVILSTILVLLAIVIGCYVLSLFGKSSNSSSSLKSWLGDSSTTKTQENTKQIQTNGVDNRRYAWLNIEYCRKSDYELGNHQNLHPYKAHECLPIDFTYDQINRYICKKYQKSDIVIVNTKIDLYAGRDSVDPIAWKISS